MEEELVWKPNFRQEEFTALPDSVFEALYGGAAGGGKSELLLLLPLLRKFHQEPRFKGIIFRRTFPELESEIIKRAEFFYPSTGARYNKENKEWSFPSKAVMKFGHMEYERDVRKYDTSEYQLGMFDELTSFTEFQYRYFIGSRLRSSTNLPVIARAGTNPGNVGHGWVRKRFIEPAPYGTLMRDKLSQQLRIFIQSLPTDNKHLDPQYIERLKLLPEAERKAKLYGDWWTFEGQVFDDFRENRLSDEPENALHVIEPFSIPDWWPRFLSIDWGYTAMMIALWATVSPDGRMYIYREYSTKKTKISQWADEVGKLTNGEHITAAVMCRSAWQNRGDDLTIAEQAIKYSGIDFGQPDNDRISGKLLCQEYLRWRPIARRPRSGAEFDPEKAQFILRTRGEAAWKQYLLDFQPEVPEGNLPKCQIFENCVELRRAIPLCVYDETRKEDVAEFEGDDPYDCWRYLTKLVDQYIDDLNRAEIRKTSVGKVLQSLNQGAIDQTSFYRRMERVERNLRSIDSKPVRRFHRARVS